MLPVTTPRTLEGAALRIGLDRLDCPICPLFQRLMSITYYFD